VVPSRGTYFHPAEIAMVAATLDELSGGRFLLGLAAGVGMSSTANETVGSTLPTSVLPVEEVESADAVPHDHSSAAWRLRHAKRSVLRETTSRIDDVSQLDDEDLWRSLERLDVDG
jgi:hypothetical protein